MKIVRGEYPPNFEEIARAIPSARQQGVIFAYGEKLYMPTGGEVSEHLMKHEALHGKRQIKMGIKKWWSQYIVDKVFRYHEELLAHRVEYFSIINQRINRNQRRAALKYVAKRLASPLYGCGGGWKRAAADILKPNTPTK